MQITSSMSSSSTAYTPAASKPTRPEDFLTDNDIKMLEHVTDTTSLSAAENDPHAQKLAELIGTQRENGWISGEYNSPGSNMYYMPAQLSDSDAKMVESMTGTTNIIDAVNAGNQGVNDLIGNIAFDRSYKYLTGDVTPGYLKDIIDFDEKQIQNYGGVGITVPLDTLKQALAYIEAEEPSKQSAGLDTSTSIYQG